MRSLLTMIVSATVSLAGMPTGSGPSSQSRSDWYLVDEIIEDTPPDYRSDIYFADKASIVTENRQSSVAISHLILTQEPEESRKSDTRIRDVRSRLVINCDEGTYSILRSAEYDRENRIVSPKKAKSDLAEWLLPAEGSGHASIVQFVCTPELKPGEQKFKDDILPLFWLIAWLNADWRN